MKKLTLLLSIAFLFSCNSGTNTQTPAENDSNQPVLAEHTHDADAGIAPETRLTTGIPELNNGEKWQADASTNANVDQLKSTVTEFKQIQQPTEEDYKTFQQNFTAGLNKMVQECKMKGPDHDALHVWLEPLMENNKQLKEEQNKTAMESVVEQMNDRLAIYSNYFN